MAREGNRRAGATISKLSSRAAGAADQARCRWNRHRIVVLRACEEMPQIAREGALHNLSPAPSAGKNGRAVLWPRRRPQQRAWAAGDFVAAAFAAADSAALPHPAPS